MSRLDVHLPVAPCFRAARLPLVGAFLALAAPALGATARADVPRAPAGARAPEVAFDITSGGRALGTFVVRLFAQEAPASTQNLLAYVDEKFYDGLVFHRVIPDFMVQGGGFDASLREKATRRPPVRNEAANGKRNLSGTLAMARTADPDSARAQFYINVVDNAALDAQAGSPGYAVVGEVISGMDVVREIVQKPTRCPSRGRAEGCEGLPPGMRDVPATPVVIRQARRVPAQAGK